MVMLTTLLMPAQQLAAEPYSQAEPLTTESIRKLITEGSAEELSQRLNQGLAPDARTKEGMPLLVMAAYTGRIEMVYTLLQHGANPNISQQPPGITALSVAAATNNVHMLGLLLAHGADKDFRAAQGDSILMLACSQTALDTIQILLAHKANPNLADANGITPLIYAIARSKEPEVISRMLLEHGANPNAAMKDGTTALIAAAMRNNAACTRLLLAHGASVSARDADGLSAQDYARNKEVRILLDAAAK